MNLPLSRAPCSVSLYRWRLVRSRPSREEVRLLSARVLIVDDEPNIVVSLEFLMRQEGYEVEIATDGEEALESLVSFRPDLVLLDVMMPSSSGVRRSPTHPDPFRTSEPGGDHADCQR